MKAFINLLCFIILFILLQISNEGSFQTFKFQMQQKVRSISNSIQQIYSTKCQNNLIRNCTVLSIDSCHGTDKRQCIQNLPKSNQCPGTGFYSRKSVIRTPNWITSLNFPEQTRQFICSTAQEQFESVLHKIQNENNQAYAWAYFGSSDGSFRFTPGFKYPQSSPNICTDYDPRLRPWYSQHAYNRKNVIIIIQTSSTMSLNGGSRFNGMILGLKALIRTFDSDDFLNIVEFNSKSRSILNVNYLLPVSENIDQRKIFFDAVGNLTTSKNSFSDYQSALLTALNIFNQTINGNQMRNDCNQNFILLFADGNPDGGQKSAINLKTLIDNQKQKIGLNLSLNIFTFNVNKYPSNLSNSILPQLSCFYGGMHFNIPQIVYQSQFMTAAQGYFQFLSHGNQITQPSWSTIYEDALGLGQMTTVVFPAYFIRGSTKRLLGVAGIDVLVSQFKKYQPDQKLIQKRLSTDGLCFVKRIRQCQIQLMRHTKCNINCTYQKLPDINIISPYNCLNKISSQTQILKEPADQSDLKCCINEADNSSSIWIGISITGLALVILLIVGLCCWRYKRMSKLTYEDLKKFQDFDMSRIRTEQQISPIHD